MADIQNIEIYQGADKTFVHTQGGGTNISGWTLSAVVRRHKEDKETAPLTVAGSISDAGNGVSDIVFADTDTDNLAPGVYYWAYWRTDAGAENVLTEGTFTIKAVVMQ